MNQLFGITQNTNTLKTSNFENRNSMLIFLIPFVLVLFGCKKIATQREESKVLFGSWQSKSNNGGFSGGRGGFGGMNMDDIFSQFGDVFGGHFSGGGGNGGRGGKRVNRGSNLRVKVKVSLEEISNGVEKKIKVNKYVACKPCSGSGAKDGSSFNTCSTCKGAGQVTRITNTILGAMQTSSACPACGGEGQSITNKCGSCHGDGIVRDEEIININLPAGVADDMQLSLSGKGNMGARGGVSGDLIIVIEENRLKFTLRQFSSAQKGNKGSDT